MDKLLKLLVLPEDKILEEVGTSITGLTGTAPIVKKGKWVHWEIDNTRPTLVAHLDTKNKVNEAPLMSEIVVTTKFNVHGESFQTISLDSNRVTCLGGDDRAGVHTIIELLRILPNNRQPNVILTYGEEIGLIGAKDFCADPANDNFTSPFMIQLDRRGDDVVFYNCENKIFQDTLVKSLNKNKGFGSSSDIRAFQTKYKINSANVSVGFDKEHTRMETINVNILNKTISGLSKLLMNDAVVNLLGTQEWTKPYAPPASAWKSQYPKASAVVSKKPKSGIGIADAINNASSQGWEVSIMDESLATKGKWLAADFLMDDGAGNVFIDIKVTFFKNAKSGLYMMDIRSDDMPSKLSELGALLQDDEFEALRGLVGPAMAALKKGELEVETIKSKSPAGWNLKIGDN